MYGKQFFCKVCAEGARVRIKNIIYYTSPLRGGYGMHRRKVRRRVFHSLAPARAVVNSERTPNRAVPSARRCSLTVSFPRPRPRRYSNHREADSILSPTQARRRYPRSAQNRVGQNGTMGRTPLPGLQSLQIYARKRGQPLHIFV